MKSIIIIDKETQNELSENLKSELSRILVDRGYENETVELGKTEAAPCTGCFKCIDGKCVIHDMVGQIRKNVSSYALTVYLTPVLFGHSSSVIKNAIDRGTGSHHRQIVIGYGRDIDEGDKAIFIDITSKHRGSADIVHQGMDKQVDVFVTRTAEENAAIFEALKISL